MIDASEYRFPFEKLHVWHLAKDLTKDVYALTKTFPSSERFGLADQLNRAAVSVMSNIAEGSARTSSKDQAHFSQLSYSSLMEAACQIQLSYELGFCSAEIYGNLRQKVHEISAKINALRRNQLDRV